MRPTAFIISTARRIAGFFRRQVTDDRLAEEIRFHLEMQAEKYVHRGMDPASARRSALLSFGGRDRWTEAVRDEYRSRPLEELARDLRYAARTLRHSPAFTLTAVVTLAVGIGANTAIFSAVDGALLKPLPYAQPERLVTLRQHDTKKGIEDADVTPGNFLDWDARTTSFSAIGAAEPYSVTLDGPDGPEMIRNWNVSAGFFPALGVRAMIGRTFEPADFAPGRERVVVISYEGWRRRFGGEPGAVGRQLRLDGAPATVVGVLPPNAAYPPGRELWSPKIFTDEDRLTRASAFYKVIARLKPDVSTAQASAEMRTVSAQLGREYPRTNADVGVTIVPMREHVVGRARPALLILLGAVGAVLLIACANVANLLLARTTRRGRELAIRAALGAGGWRVARQLLAEALLLAFVGTAGGVVLAYWSLAAIRALSPASLPRLGEMQIDLRALIFALGVAVLTTALFGLAPALRAARADVNDQLRAGGRTAGAVRSQNRFRHALVVAEVALAVVLLVGAGLLARSFVTLIRVDRGYRADHVLTANVFIWQWNETPAQRAAFVSQAVERLAALPGVRSAAATSALPIPERIGGTTGKFTVVDRAPPSAGEEPGAYVTVASDGLFDVLGIPLRAGRSFTRDDNAVHPQVALINSALARQYWPNENPVGKRISLRFQGPPVEREIIGIVGDIRESGLEAAPQPAVFVPHAQSPTGSLTLVVRTTGDPAASLPAVRSALAELNRELPIASSATLEALLADTLKLRRFNLLLLSSFSLTALILSVVGVYGLIAQAASERTREIGVRIALGAGGRDVLALVMRQGVAPALAGIAGGLIAALALTRVLHGMLYAVTPLDAPTFLAVPALMFATAVMACWLPARRATRVDPLVALRGD